MDMHKLLTRLRNNERPRAAAYTRRFKQIRLAMLRRLTVRLIFGRSEMTSLGVEPSQGAEKTPCLMMS